MLEASGIFYLLNKSGEKGVNTEEEVCVSMVSRLNAKVVSCVILLREVSRRMFRCVWTDDFLLC